jgi:hypothetical protein
LAGSVVSYQTPNNKTKTKTKTKTKKHQFNHRAPYLRDPHRVGRPLAGVFGVPGVRFRRERRPRESVAAAHKALKRALEAAVCRAHTDGVEMHDFVVIVTASTAAAAAAAAGICHMPGGMRLLKGHARRGARVQPELERNEVPVFFFLAYIFLVLV